MDWDRQFLQAMKKIFLDCVECHVLKRQNLEFEKRNQKLQHEIDISNRIHCKQSRTIFELQRQLSIFEKRNQEQFV